MDDKRWQILYRTTVLESDGEKLQACVKAAEDAINGRAVALSGNIPWEGRVAMGNALSALWVLKRERERCTVDEPQSRRVAWRSKCVERRPNFAENAGLRLEDEPKYRVLLYQRGTPEEFEWSKTEVQVFLGTCLSSDSPVAEAIAEADEKGSATRTMEYAPGYTARVVLLRVAPWWNLSIIDTSPIVWKTRSKWRA
jgi:hypothetical protein